MESRELNGGNNQNGKGKCRSNISKYQFSFDINKHVTNIVKTANNAKPILSGIKRKRDEELKDDGAHKRAKRPTNVLKSLLNYESDSSESEAASDASDSSEYDFIKKAREGVAKTSAKGGNIEDNEKAINHANNVKKVLNDTNQGK